MHVGSTFCNYSDCSHHYKHFSSRRSAGFTTVSQRGFTIVELLIVIVVIGILAGISIVAYSGIQNNAKAASLQSDLAQAVKQLEVYKVGTSASAQYPVDLATGNLKASSGTTYTYYYNASNNNYCLQAVNAGISYSVSSIDTTPRAGDCTTNGLVGWWNFNGNANDSSGNNNDGTNNGATLTIGQNGQANSAYSFNGSSRISLPNTAAVSGNGVYSISIWMKAPAFGTYGLIGWGQWGTYNSVNAIRLDASGQVGNYWWYNDLFVTAPSLSNNAWHHVVFTFDGTTRIAYVDNVALGSNTPSGYNAVAIDVNIGRTNSSEYFLGSIDDVRVYNRALSSTEVTALYTAGAQ